ncbi:MAG TPA: hypothetical protein VJ578_04865 [Dehalococcoidia bacterium]|nr:hypothetical protein [Dehalococcoidia bacterium]
MTTRTDGSRRRLAVTARTVIRAPRSEIFALCCPVREEDWIDGWSRATYDLVFSESGFNEKNCIFREGFTKRLFFGEEGATTWVTTVHEPTEFALEFLLIFGDIAVLNRKMRLDELDTGATACDCTDTLILLQGILDDADLATLEMKMKMFLHFTWNALRHYCETGEVLRAPPTSVLRRARGERM